MTSNSTTTNQGAMRRQRARLMSGASVALIVALAPAGVYASPSGAEVTVFSDGTSTMVGNVVVGSSAPQTNSATVNAAIDAATAGIQRTGTATGNTDIVSANSIAAQAGANSFTNGDDTLLSSVGTAPDTGIALSGVSINNGIVTSSVSESSTSISLTGATSGAASNSGNTISATTTLNSGTSVVGGATPVDYQPLTSPSGVIAGVDFFSEIGPIVQASGTIAMSTVQQSLINNLSAATVADSSATLDLDNTTNATYAGAAALDTNSIAARFTGNQATSTVSLASSTSGFQGTASIANLQQFGGTGFFDDIESNSASAAVDGSSVRARIGSSNDIESGLSSTALTGSLSVSGNGISSIAHGNEALAATGGAQTYGNQIKLADGQSFTGSGVSGGFGFLGGAGAAALGEFGPQAVGIAFADLAIVNTQSLGNVEFGGSVSSLTRDATVNAQVEAVNGAAVAVANNTINSAATGNAASSGILNGTGAALFSGSAAVANAQSNFGTAVSANTSDGSIGLLSLDYPSNIEGSLADGKLNSQLAVTGNSVTSSAYGSDAAQAISLTATTLGNGSAPGQVGTIPGAIATGVASIASTQTSVIAPVSASTDGTIFIAAEGFSSPSHTALLLDSNRVEAVAIGASVSNSLALTGTSITGGTGLANVQSNLISPVLASTFADVEGFVAGPLQNGSSLSVTNNLARAIAYANTATNDASLSAGNLTIDQSGPGTIDAGTGGAGAVALVNSQSSLSDVTSNLAGSTATDVSGDVLGGSKVVNSGNTSVAATYGNQVSNTASVSLNSLTIIPVTTDVESTPVPLAGNMASLGSITNVQSVVGNTISAAASYANLSQVGGDIEASSVSSSNNLIQAVAAANRADSNKLTVSGTNLIDADNYQAGLQLVNQTGRHATGVFNTQTSVANVDAQTLASDIAPGSAGIQVNAGIDVTQSSVTALANQQFANATGNIASNALALTATTLQTTAGVQNVQANAGVITAQLGAAESAATPGTLDQPFSYTATVTSPSANCIGASCTVTGGTAQISTVLTQGEINALVNDGWTLSSGVLTRNASYLVTLSLAAYGALLGTVGVTGSSVIPGLAPMAGIPNTSGVSIVASGSVVNSVLRVANNVGAAGATGNSAANVLTVSATALSADGSNGLAYAGDNAGLTGPGAPGVSADYGIINSQSSTGPIATSSYGTYAIAGTTDALLYDNATLDVSGNQQIATAFGNTAVTSLTAATGTIAATPLSAGLLSTQTSGASVGSLSNLEVFTPVVAVGSAVTLNDNSNTAAAVANDATNSVSASATNLVGTGDGLVTTTAATGNLALHNEQDTTAGLVTATAVTTIANQEGVLSYTGGQTVPGGIDASSVAMNGNSTLAQAVANQAINSVALNAGAGGGGSTALSSNQTNASDVASNASSTIGVSLTTSGESEFGALNATSLTVTGNTTVATARGNLAVNSAMATTGGSYLPNGGQANSSDTAFATNAVLNAQSNTAAISATATSVNTVQALNGSMSNSAVTIGGNATLASAFGNAATNRLAVTQGVGGAPSGAVVNNQYNSGSVGATVSNVSYTMGVVGATTGSSLGVTGNTIGATAIGNTALSTITAR